MNDSGQWGDGAGQPRLLFSTGSVSVLVNVGHPVPGTLLHVEQVCGNCGGWMSCLNQTVLISSECRGHLGAFQERNPTFLVQWRPIVGFLNCQREVSTRIYESLELVRLEWVIIDPTGRRLIHDPWPVVTRPLSCLEISQHVSVPAWLVFGAHQSRINFPSATR